MAMLQKKIESIMNDNGRQSSHPMEWLLFGLSRCYHSIMKLRGNYFRQNPKQSKRLPCMVISIGNITVGGTGKTPMTIYLANLIKDSGYKIAIVSRGYGGKASKRGGIVCDGEKILLGPELAGDEPYMMAKHLQDVPIVVGSNRFQAGMAAITAFSPDIILLDDGFQHQKLKRDLDILLLDATLPFGNGHLLPRGTLREPIEMIQRATVFILTRAGNSLDPETSFRKQLSTNGLEEFFIHTPLFLCSHKSYLHSIIEPGADETTGISASFQKDRTSLAGLPVFAFSGIAKNQDFRASVENLGCKITDHLEFSDHYEYKNSDFITISQAAKRKNARWIITTEKDYVKVAEKFQWPLPLAVLGVAISFSEEQTFQKLIFKKIQQYRS